MPIITKTVSHTDSIPLSERFLRMVKAVAEAVGSQYCVMDGITDGAGTAYTHMKSIGYPGWCFAMRMSETPSVYILTGGIYRTIGGDSGPPDFDDPYKIEHTYSGTGFFPDIAGDPETCVMISDSSKDTVLFDVHIGSSMHGTDLNYESKRHMTISYDFFLAKDINDEVLCGFGHNCIMALRTRNNKILNNTPGSDISNEPVQKPKSLSGTLHLTKMINYLSTDCPEMKSAYVSLVRPVEDFTSKKFVSLLAMDGKNFGRAGAINSFNDENYYINTPYFPFEPFVEY